MDFSKFFTSKFYKKLAKTFYEDVIYPAAQEYVKDTENPWDDQVLKFLNDFAEKFLSEA